MRNSLSGGALVEDGGQVLVLADSNIWVKHLRQNNNILDNLARETCLVMHPFVIGEVACGSIANRMRELNRMKRLPCMEAVADEVVWNLIETNQWMSCGIGYVDAHLLAAVINAVIHNEPIKLWSEDKKLKALAKKKSVLYP